MIVTIRSKHMHPTSAWKGVSKRKKDFMARRQLEKLRASKVLDFVQTVESRDNKDYEDCCKTCLRYG